MRTWVAVAVILAACGGDGSTEQAGDAGGDFFDTVSIKSDASQFFDTVSENSGGSANQGGAANGGAGGMQGGEIPGTGGVAEAGGAAGTTGGSAGTVAVDPLEPYPSACEGFTQFRVPRQTCAVVRGRFTVWGGSKACGPVDGSLPVKICTIIANLDQCPPKNGQDPAGLCEGEILLSAVKAEPGKEFAIKRYGLVANKCPQACE